MKPFLKGDMKDTKLYFYDITAKVNFKLNKNNNLFVSSYLGRDVFGFGNEANMNWGNNTALYPLEPHLQQPPLPQPDHLLYQIRLQPGIQNAKKANP